MFARNRERTGLATPLTIESRPAMIRPEIYASPKSRGPSTPSKAANCQGFVLWNWQALVALHAERRLTTTITVDIDFEDTTHDNNNNNNKKNNLMGISETDITASLEDDGYGSDTQGDSAEDTTIRMMSDDEDNAGGELMFPNGFKANPHSARGSSSSSDEGAIEVCTVASNPRQGSIFRSDVMSYFGSGKYRYTIEKNGKCSWKGPRVRMIPYVRCCTELTFVNRQILASTNVYDITIITGDEFCAVKTTGLFQYRQYYGDNVIGDGLGAVSKIDGKTRIPMFFPLGPRSEFRRIESTELYTTNSRKYLLNFVGSPTSVPRKQLKKYFRSDAWTASPWASKSLIHITNGWSQQVNVARGYLQPDRYRSILLQSKFTLCPMGHNPEAYRIYEACEAGSIPIVTVEEPDYVQHKCSNAYKPFIDAGAPFIFLKEWKDLEEFLANQATNQTFIQERQAQVVDWYRTYMQDTAKQFEEMLEFRWARRMRLYPNKNK